MKPKQYIVYYTTKMHVAYLKEILKMERPCNGCPAWMFQKKHLESPLWITKAERSICKRCKTFINLNPSQSCPCQELGAKKAMKRTKAAIKEYENKKTRSKNETPKSRVR